MTLLGVDEADRPRGWRSDESCAMIADYNPPSRGDSQMELLDELLWDAGQHLLTMPSSHQARAESSSSSLINPALMSENGLAEEVGASPSNTAMPSAPFLWEHCTYTLQAADGALWKPAAQQSAFTISVLMKRTPHAGGSENAHDEWLWHKNCKRHAQQHAWRPFLAAT